MKVYKKIIGTGLLVWLILSLACRSGAPKASGEGLLPQQSLALPLTAGPSNQLGFLNEGDVWTADFSTGSVTRLTYFGDILSFVWSPDGQRVAAFNGQDLCLMELNQSDSSSFCFETGLSGVDSLIPEYIFWSPDHRYIIIANSSAWLLIPLENPSSVLYVQDFSSWGVEVLPGIPGSIHCGQPIFLPDGSLIGTFTHDAYCGSGGCVYKMSQFNFDLWRFVPYQPDAYQVVDIGKKLSLSKDGKVLVNFGTYHMGCENFVTSASLFYLESGETYRFQMEQEAAYQMSVNPDGSLVLISRGVGCASQNNSQWAISCGLSAEYEIFPMQVWKPQSSNPPLELVPGMDPIWSPDGMWVAFRSCLTPAGENQWQTTSAGSPWIFMIKPDSGPASVIPVYQGSAPAWRP